MPYPTLNVVTLPKTTYHVNATQLLTLEVQPKQRDADRYNTRTAGLTSSIARLPLRLGTLLHGLPGISLAGPSGPQTLQLLAGGERDGVSPVDALA